MFLKVDSIGRVYCTGPGGIWVMAPDGKRFGIIRWPEQCSAGRTCGRCCVARTSVYTLRVTGPRYGSDWVNSMAAAISTSECFEKFDRTCSMVKLSFGTTSANG